MHTDKGNVESFRILWRAVTGVVCATLIAAAHVPVAEAGCNAVAPLDVTFRSTLGEASTALAKPGQTVTIQREAAVFDQIPANNSITIDFTPPDGADTQVAGVVALAPAPDEECDVATCQGGMCPCVSFVFPDTDALFGPPADGLPLTGPARITVETGGDTTAIIDELFESDSPFTNAVFSSFVGLPPATSFEDLVTGSTSDLLGATDTAGNLFIPIDYSSLVPVLPSSSKPRFVEATIPALTVLDMGCGDVPIEVFTEGGSRLPPLLRRIPATTSVIGTTDAQGTILRVEQVKDCAGLLQAEGPIVVPGVDAFAEPEKLADGVTILVGDQFAVYENHECNLRAMAEASPQCDDFNNDGDQDDYFLYGLDLTVPNSSPFIIDEVDAGDTFAGYPDPTKFPEFNLYTFDASDQVVSFLISDAGGLDIDDDGETDEILRSGGYDLTLLQQIADASGTTRIEVDGSLVAFSQETTAPPCNPTCRGLVNFGLACTDPSDCGGDSCGCDQLFIYDAQVGPPAQPVGDAMHSEFFVSRFLGFTVPGIGRSAFDFAVADGRVAFLADERSHNEDLNGNLEIDDQALYLVDGATPDQALNLQQVAVANLSLSSRWLPFLTKAQSGMDPVRFPIGLVDIQSPLDPPLLICDEGSFSPFYSPFTYASLSDTIVPCGVPEVPGIATPDDLNGDGDDDTGDFVLKAYLPEAMGGAVEQNLMLASILPEGFFVNVQVSGDTMVSAVEEIAQDEDLDGDAEVGLPQPMPDPNAPNYVLHSFHAQTGEAVNFGLSVFGGTSPFTKFIDRGLSVVLPTNRRVLLRDIDDDGHFEEFVTDPDTLERHVADNCPTVANPTQDDADDDGVGDVCDLCTNIAGGMIRPKVRLTKIASDQTPGDDGLRIKAEFPVGTSFASIDPTAGGTGLRLLVDSGDAKNRVDVTVPPGSFDGTSGWTKNTAGTKYTFVDRARPPTYGGIVKVTVRDRGDNRVKLRIRGKQATYPVRSEDPPLTTTVILGEPAAGECGENGFAPTDCRFNGAGNKLVCRG